MAISDLRTDAFAIWQAGVDAVKCDHLIAEALGSRSSIRGTLEKAKRIVVVGGGKAGSAMAAAVEYELFDCLNRISGIVNIPDGTKLPLKSIYLHAARPAGSNEPTEAGVEGTREMLNAVKSTRPNDVLLCLLSGGGSALLPAPVSGISLAHKLVVTRLLSRCGANIGEMNCVRKHLSRIKGGGLAAAAKCPVYCLIVSDVIGDPLDVIASGPTAADPTTFADALCVLRKFDLLDEVPNSVRTYLEAGVSGKHHETLKTLPDSVHNIVIGNNARALAAAEVRAKTLGYQVMNLGDAVAGETVEVARNAAGIVRSISADAPPTCVLIGGETTVTLPAIHGRGGRNTEFVLASLLALHGSCCANFVILSGGTDGEDGPTDAAGAVCDSNTLRKASEFDAGDFLLRHDSYTFFATTGDLLRTGLTQTNVMDLRVLLIGKP